MHKLSVSKDMKKIINNDKKRKEVAVGKVGGAFMSNTNSQRAEN